MSQLVDFFRNLFDTSDWPARWDCGIWSDFHGWLYIFSDTAIWGAYFAIPFILAYFIQQKTEIPFKSIIWLFILFILFCGSTHLIDALIFYVPAYRVSALIRFLTAGVSWVTVFALVRNMPDIMALKSPHSLEKIVQQRTRELEESASYLQMKNTQLENFAEITSHNLRSPLGNMVALLSLYDHVSDPKERDDLIGKMKTVSNKMMQTVTDLSTVVLNTRTEAVISEAIDLEALTKDICQTLTEDIQKSGIRVITNFRELPVIHYHRPYLESILLNLITNAIKYRDTAKESYVRLTGSREDGIDMLRVEDNGLGIDMKRYGDKLFKLHKTFHRHQDARGVGLFITRNQIESLGGTIEADSQVGMGTTFVIRFNAFKSNRI